MSRNRRDAIGLALSLTILLLLFSLTGNSHEPTTYGPSLLSWLIRQWRSAGSEAQHGWLAITVSAYLVWRKRGDLSAIKPSTCLVALPLAAVSLVLIWAGIRTQQPRLGILGTISLLWAIPLYYGGIKAGRILAFPAAFLIFSIPMGFLQAATLPLRLIASHGAVLLLNGLGIEVVQQGTAIISTSGNRAAVDVAAACSGLQSILALLALSTLYAYLALKRLHTRSLLALSAFPIAVAGNIIRIVTVAVVALVWGQEQAISFSHDLSGYIVFVVAVLLMAWLAGLLRKWEDPA
jgi:exosortase